MHSKKNEAEAWTAVTRRIEADEGGFDFESLGALRDRLRSINDLLSEGEIPPGTKPFLLWRDPEGGGKSHFSLSGEVCLVGRHEACSLQLDFKEVSRRHCLLEVQGDLVCLKDDGSLNGTLVNGECVKGALYLRTGDAISIGPVTLYLILPAEEPDYQVSHAAERKQ